MSYFLGIDVVLNPRIDDGIHHASQLYSRDSTMWLKSQQFQ
ncbi:hypothetical protein [Budvicia aquatica]|nr:hypothetical protein [Budvicia aquatica]